MRSLCSPWVRDRNCLNQKQTSIPLFLFSLRLHWLLLFVHGFVSGPSSCSISIFCVFMYSRWKQIKIPLLKPQIFFFFFCKNSQLCIMIQMRRRNTPSFITAWEHRRVQWVDRIFAFVYIGEKNAGSLVSFGYWKYLLQPSLSDSWALKKAVTSCLVPYVHTPTPTAICDRWCLNSLKYWCKHCVYMN